MALTPWRAWLRFVGAIFGFFAGITGVRGHHRGLIWLMGGVCLWLAYDERQPAYLGSVTILALVLAVPVWDKGWRRARHQIGDTYLHQVGLGRPLVARGCQMVCVSGGVPFLKEIDYGHDQAEEERRARAGV